MRKKYNLRQGGEYKAECGNYHKKAGDDCDRLFLKYYFTSSFSSRDDCDRLFLYIFF